jgi:anoctamin-10
MNAMPANTFRIRDWLHGVRATQPDREAHRASEGDAVTEAERYRVIHHLLTAPPADGGAGITPQTGQWKHVESLFPLHDPAHNKEWIKRWSTRTFLKMEDLDEIRDKLGEKVSCILALTPSLTK